MAGSVNIRVDSSELKKYEKDLKKLHKSAYPVAVRSTLNNAAFEMKKDDFQKSVKKNFKGLKSKQFFVRHSGVEKATGFNVKTMNSKMGMLEMGNPAARKAVSEMPKHEKSGVIDDGVAYLKHARRSSNLRRFVRTENYYDRKKVISGRSPAGRGEGTRKSKFVARAFRAKNEDKPFFMNTLKGNVLVKVTSIKKKGRDSVKIKSRLLLMERKRVKIKANHFASEAGKSTSKKIPKMYEKEFGKQIKKYRK